MQTRHRVPYVIVYVADLDASERFYTQVLGLRVRDFPIASTMAGKARALSMQGTTLVLIQKDGGAEYLLTDSGQGGGPDAGHCFPSFEVENLDGFHGDALNSRVECVKPPTGDRFGRMAVYRDPDGLLFTVVQPAPAKQADGIVMSGGGAYGAFELGVMRVLGSRPGAMDREPEVLTGTSVGAYNAAFVACGLGYGKPFSAAVEDLIYIWKHRIAGGWHDNGVYRLRGDIMRWPGFGEVFDDAVFLAKEAVSRVAYAITPPPLLARLLHTVDISTLFSVAPLRNLIADTISWGALSNSPCQLQIAATDWKDGQVRLFGHGPKPSPQEESMRVSNLRDSILASTAIPGIFPPVEVECDGPSGREVRTFVDGGLLMNSPINPAIDVGATSIHLICLNPEVSKLPLSPITSTLGVFERALVTAVAGNIQSDIDRARLVNRIAGIVRRKHSDEFYRPLTIHRYHPSREVLGGMAGILDFSKDHVGRLIEDGEKVAREHDCVKAGCVLPV